METVHECSQLCRDTAGCSFITFYGQNHQGMADTCFLLSAIKEPIRKCENCESSPIDCSESMCGFLDSNGTMIPSGVLLTESIIMTTLRLGKCGSLLKVLAVGGGGEQDYFSGGICHYSSGGGSGYVTYEEVSLLNGTVPQHFQIDVSVGERQSYQWKTTSVTIASGTDDLTDYIEVSAETGEEGKSGDGYSGGGGRGRQCLNQPDNYPGGDGGCNGGDGMVEIEKSS